MLIKFKEVFGKTLLCHIELCSDEVNKKVVDVSESFANCSEIILVSALNGINSNLSWKGTKVFFEDSFNERDLLILIKRGN